MISFLPVQSGSWTPSWSTADNEECLYGWIQTVHPHRRLGKVIDQSASHTPAHQKTTSPPRKCTFVLIGSNKNKIMNKQSGKILQQTRIGLIKHYYITQWLLNINKHGQVSKAQCFGDTNPRLYIYLWCNVVWCPTKCRCSGISEHFFSTHAKVCDFYVPVFVQHHIIQLQIPVGHSTNVVQRFSGRSFGRCFALAGWILTIPVDNSFRVEELQTHYYLSAVKSESQKFGKMNYNVTPKGTKWKKMDGWTCTLNSGVDLSALYCTKYTCSAIQRYIAMRSYWSLCSINLI